MVLTTVLELRGFQNFEPWTVGCVQFKTTALAGSWDGEVHPRIWSKGHVDHGR